MKNWIKNLIKATMKHINSLFNKEEKCKTCKCHKEEEFHRGRS